jgi:hypothetical protein
MNHLESYRKIVELQEEIIRISSVNAHLRNRCEELEIELARNMDLNWRPGGLRTGAQSVRPLRRLRSWLITALKSPGSWRNIPA